MPKAVIWYTFALAALLSALLSACGQRNLASSAERSVAPADLVIHNVKIYPQPGAPAIEESTLIVRDGRIAELRSSQPGDASLAAHSTINGANLSLSAGLWNSHVHFTAPNLATQPQQVIDSMLLRFGFTHVVDTGSVLAGSLALRNAVNNKTLQGPHIVLANGSFVATDGTPSYLPGIKLPEVKTPEGAEAQVKEVLNAGADGIKIFSGSFQTPQHTIYLPVPLISAIASAAHQKGSFVMAHPTTIKGLHNAVLGGVDVIAHTAPPEAQLPAELLAQMKKTNTALIPTLKLWRYEMRRFGQPEQHANAMESAAVEQLRTLHSFGIEILFGTDVGYMTEFDTADEYALMNRAGMDWPDIHRALTVAPAQRFEKYAGSRSGAQSSAKSTAGTLYRGAAANLVIFNGDPAREITALADIAYTIVDGEVVYQASSTSPASVAN